MKNTIGNLLTITLFGESHGDVMGVVIDGLPAGIPVNQDFINKQMNKRKPQGSISTSRHETDEAKIVSGVFNHTTTGSPCCILIENKNQQSKDYSLIKDVARPSHADFSANEKYFGYQDYRGGGHFSGRLTAPIVAAGAIALTMLESKGITLGTHIIKLNKINDEPFSNDENICLKQIDEINDKIFATISASAENEMIKTIDDARMNQDSVGGILETMILNFPSGVGEPSFDSLESRLSHAMFSIGAVKGIEFGLGFDFANYTASQCNDQFINYHENIKTSTNNNGGINGGISNGMPIHFKTVIKPTPSISKNQDSVNFKTKEKVDLVIEGRHDPAIIHRARVVVDSMTALTLVDCLIERYGILWFQDKKI